MSKLKIPFGLRDGQLRDVANVPNGLACACVCPACGARLVAKHPKRKVAHFAHHTEDACLTGYETALHLAAKQALVKRREVFVPAIEARKYLYDGGTDLSVKVSKEIPAKTVALDSVEEESRDFEGAIPDVVASYKGKLLFVEIAVTHFVDSIKLGKLKQIGIPTLEIDLSHCPEIPTLAEIESLVVTGVSNRTWLVNPRQQALQLQVEAEAQQELESRVVSTAKSKLLMWSQHDKYMRLTDTEKLQLEIAGSRLTFNDLSPYIGKRVRGGRSFGVNPSVWQAAVFRMFICNGNSWTIEAEEVANWLSEHLALNPPFPNAEKVAVWDYLVHLEAEGILNRLAGQSFEVFRDAPAPFTDPDAERGNLPF